MIGLSIVEDTKMTATTFAAERLSDSGAPVILIVDDDADSRDLLKFLLQMWKYKVIEAADGEEAVRVAEKTRPDLILMDVRLPLLDGVSATRQIRKFNAGGAVPVVFLSGCAEAVYKEAARAAGGNEYVVKPFDFNELHDAIGKYVAC